jgi:hypothetical protein
MATESRLKLFGLPLVHVASGSFEDGRYRRGIARGWIAVGDIAFGVVLAVGGVAVGGVSIGGVGLGLLAVGEWPPGCSPSAGLHLGSAPPAGRHLPGGRRAVVSRWPGTWPSAAPLPQSTRTTPPRKRCFRSIPSFGPA